MVVGPKVVVGIVVVVVGAKVVVVVVGAKVDVAVAVVTVTTVVVVDSKVVVVVVGTSNVVAKFFDFKMTKLFSFVLILPICIIQLGHFSVH